MRLDAPDWVATLPVVPGAVWKFYRLARREYCDLILDGLMVVSVCKLPQPEYSWELPVDGFVSWHARGMPEYYPTAREAAEAALVARDKALEQ